MDEPISNAGTEWDRRFNAGDAAGLAELYAADVVSMPPNAPTVTGREAVRKEFQSFFAANTARHETMTDQIIRQGDLAIERARYVLTFKPKSGVAEIRETGRHVECRRRIDGTWQIVWEIWNTEGTGK